MKRERNLDGQRREGTFSPLQHPDRMSAYNLSLVKTRNDGGVV